MFNKSRKKILIVDDEEEIVTFLGNFLRRAKFEVIGTTEGKQAVELAKAEAPNLIILDILIPDLSGDKVASQLQDFPSTSRIPIIFLTGLLSKEEELAKGQTENKRYVLAKPVSTKDLLEKINQVLAAE